MIKKLLDLLTKHERKQAGVLLVVSLAFKAVTTYAQLYPDARIQHRQAPGGRLPVR